MSADRPRQLPLDFGHMPAFSREDLVVSPANSDAVSLIERWPSWPTSVSILEGPAGSGKSHLASIWGTRAAATQVAADDLSRLQEMPLASAVLVDDADSQRLDENGLFHVLNAARQSGGHVLLTGRAPPSAWNLKLADLASRLQAATNVKIREPDDLLLAAVITKLFADRQVQVEASVVQFLLKRMERSLSAANRLVDQLDRLALERKARITRSLAAELLDVDAADDGDVD